MAGEGSEVDPIGVHNAAVCRTGVKPYEVGTYRDFKAKELVGDALDIHHAGQAHPLEQVIPGYVRGVGPSIALPELEYGAIPTLRGLVTDTPRQILANDIRNLRAFTNATNSSLKEFINLNKLMYPGAF